MALLHASRGRRGAGTASAAALARMLMLALAGLGAGCDSCSGRPPEDRGAEGGAASTTEPPVPAERSPAEAAEDADRDASEPFVEAGNRFRDAQPKADTDAEGPVDPACIGRRTADVALAAAVVDARCAIGRERAKKLRALLEHDGGPPVSLRQDAKVLDDGRVALRLVNTGSVALVLPLIFSATLPAFLVMAEDEGRTLYELAPPRFDVTASRTRAHFARIVLEPGGVAVATIAIDPGIASVVARRGGDRGDAGASRLARGHYVLRVGELLTDVEAGAPALVPFDVR
jgi:hypothetical protein